MPETPDGGWLLDDRMPPIYEAVKPPTPTSPGSPPATRRAANGLPAQPVRADFATEPEFQAALQAWIHRVGPAIRAASTTSPPTA